MLILFINLIGGLIMTHSDDKGLVLPPKVAPRKSVLVPIFRKEEERASVMEVAMKLAKDLGAHIDTRDMSLPYRHPKPVKPTVVATQRRDHHGTVSGAADTLSAGFLDAGDQHRMTGRGRGLARAH